MNIIIEPATDADIDTIIEVRNRSFLADYQRYGECPGYGQDRAHIEGLLEQCHLYNIQCDGSIVGNISCKRLGDGGYYLGCVCVVPEYEGQGIGFKAMAFLDDRFPGVHWRLETPADKLRNHRFYEKHGYRITERLLDGAVEIVRMEKGA